MKMTGQKATTVGDLLMHLQSLDREALLCTTEGGKCLVLWTQTDTGDLLIAPDRGPTRDEVIRSMVEGGSEDPEGEAYNAYPHLFGSLAQPAQPPSI